MLLGQSKYRIVRALLDGDRTAERLSRMLRLSVTAVRKHVEAMEQTGLVSARFEKANLGRPKKFYSLTEEGRDLVSRKYDAFLVSLLDKLSLMDRKLARQLLRSIASDIAGKVKSSIPNRGGGAHPSLQEKLVGVSNVLNEIGFSSRVEKSRDGFKLVRTNCVILRAAKEHPELVCKVFDTAFLKSALGQNVKLIETMACGYKQCVHSI
jgi:predicted ArsR family transcriptional regulator